jgi:hypothetical protein
MKIAIIGSTQYKDKFIQHKTDMEAAGHEVRLPSLDEHDLSPLGILQSNLDLIVWADEIHLIWDCRSVCTWGDFCMAFALEKPVIPVYLEEKLMKDIIIEYAKKEG